MLSVNVQQKSDLFRQNSIEFSKPSLITICFKYSLILLKVTIQNHYYNSSILMKKALGYNILTDNHMYYFLQSVPKVKELLQSGLFKIQGKLLIDCQTRQSVQLQSYVYERVKDVKPGKHDKSEELEKVLQSQKFKLFTQERQKAKRMKTVGGISAPNSPKAKKIDSLENIRGLKEFLSKNLR